MRAIICRECGARWTDQFPEFTSVHFSTTTLSASKEKPLSLSQIFASGENLLTCPKDRMEPLDTAIQESYNGPRSQARKGPKDVDSH